MKYCLQTIACSMIFLSGCNNSQPNNDYQPQGYNQGQQGFMPNQQGPQQQAPQMPAATATQQAPVPASNDATNSEARRVNCTVDLNQYDVYETGTCDFVQKNGNGSFTLDNFASGSGVRSVEVAITSPGEAVLYVDLGGKLFEAGMVKRKGACWIGTDVEAEVCAK